MSDIQYYLSGGPNNSSPINSLGGLPSAKKLSTGVNNLFPQVTREQITSGTTQYACIYIFNEGSETLEDVTISLEQDNDYSTASLGITSATEVQKIQLTGAPTSGSFVLTYTGTVNGIQVSQNTDPITFSADPIAIANNIQVALNDLTLLGEVTVTAIFAGKWTYTIEFGGDLALRYHVLLVVASNDIIGSDKMTVQRAVKGGPVNTTAIDIPLANQPPFGITFTTTAQCGILHTLDGIAVWLKRVTIPGAVGQEEFTINIFAE